MICSVCDNSECVVLLTREEEEEPEVEYVEGYEMEEEDNDAMEDFARSANKMSE